MAKRIGLIGGMSWESTALYYAALNRGMAARRGGLHSAPLLLWSVDFAEIAALQGAGRWDAAGAVLADAARRLEGAGAELLLIGANTMHRVFDAVQAAVTVPVLHIADAVGEAIRAAGLARVGLLGTRYTMEMDFYRARLGERFGIELLVPGPDDRTLVHDTIYTELCRGIVRPETEAAYRGVIDRMRAEGAEGVILGCTEIGLLLAPGSLPVPDFDSMELHARAALDAALA